MRPPFRVALVGMPGSGRTTLAARVVEAATRTLGLASLPSLPRELELRGQRREDPGARPGSRTTRQILDAVLRDGALEPGWPEDESLYLDVGGTTVELVDAAGARFANDALAADPHGPLRALERGASGAVLVLDALAWGGARVREADRDRARAFLARLREGERPVPVVVALTRKDAAPEATDPGALLGLGSDVPRVPVARGDDAGPAALARWVVGQAAGTRPVRVPRLGAALLLLGALTLGYGIAGVLAVRSVAGAPLVLDAEGERAFLEGAEARLASPWLAPFPSGGARAALAEHGRNLERLLRRDHPALSEPDAAANLQPAQYRSAAQALALVDVELGPDAARAALEERLRRKARIADLPPARPDTLPAWEELWRTTPDPALREGAITPRLRPVLAFLAREAEREAQAIPSYPAFLEPLRRFRAAHVPAAGELAAEALARQWDRAFAVLAPERGLPDLGTVLAFLEAAPERPPPSFLARAGRLAAAILLARRDEALAGERERLERALGEAGARGALAALPAAYEELVVLPAALGPARLARVTSAVAALPRAPLAPLDARRLEAFAAHLADLAAVRSYSLAVVRARVAAKFDAFYDAFDLVVGVAAERAGPERTLPARDNAREAVFDRPVFGPGELAWRAWDRLELRVTDDNRPVGIRRRDPGSCFGLHAFAGEWLAPDDEGAVVVAVEPAPPAPFDFRGWPE